MRKVTKYESSDELLFDTEQECLEWEKSQGFAVNLRKMIEDSGCFGTYEADEIVAFILLRKDEIKEIINA